jgi:hypothetical protein
MSNNMITVMAHQAAKSGCMEFMQMVYEKYGIIDPNACRLAARNHDVSCLQYAHEHGCTWDELTCVYTNIECLRYAHENGCPWDDDAYYGHRVDSACYKYLKANGCPEKCNKYYYNN